MLLWSHPSFGSIEKKLLLLDVFFAESTLNLLLNKPFLAENSILENTKLFGKCCKCLLYRIENDLNNRIMCWLCVHRDMKHMKSSSWEPLCFRELNASTNAYEWASRLHLIHKNTRYYVSFFKTGDKGLAGTMDPFGWLIWDRIIRFSARHTWRSRNSSSLNSEGKIGAEILFCTFIYYHYFQVQSCSKIGYSDCNGILFFFFATKTD